MRRLVSRSFRKPSAVCAPVFVASTILSRIDENAAPTFCSLSEYARAVSKKVDATVIRLVQQVDRILLSDALDRQAAKSVFLDDKIRLAKRDLVHGNSPSYLGYPKHSKIALFCNILFPA